MIVIIASVLDRKHVVPRVLRHRKSYMQSDFSIPCCPALQCHILEGMDSPSFVGTGEPQTLTPKRIQQGLSHETSEWHNGRLANTTSFLASNLRQLVGITNLSPTAQELTEDQSFKRTGIPQLASHFPTSDGKKLAQAARYLDFNAGEERNEEDLAVALVHLFKEIPKLSSWCQRSALYSVKLLAASLQILEAVGVVDDREGWAESLHVQREKNTAHRC